MKHIQLARHEARHFGFAVTGKVATITLNRPERKNPLTFDSYGELRDLFRDMVYATDVKAIVFTGSGGNFCSGGDVHEIIGPLVKMEMPELLEFTRMTGDLVKAMRACPQPIVAAINGVCTGPTFGHAMTKTMLWQEWSSGLGECIEAEAQAQAICMQTQDFERAYHAFAGKHKPVFQGD